MSKVISAYLRALVGTLAFRVARRNLPPRTLARKCQRVLASVNL